MAQTIAKLNIHLGAQTATLRRDFQQAGHSLTRFGKTTLAANKNVALLTRSLRSLTAFLAPVAATAALLGFARSAEAFEQSMASSTAIMGDLSDAMRRSLEQTAKQVAFQTKFSAKEASEAYFFLASAGLDAAQAIAALPQVAKFAQAGMFDLSLATDLATDAQSALGLSVADAQQNLANLHARDRCVGESQHPGQRQRAAVQ